MKQAVFAFTGLLLGTLVFTTGCTTKKRHERDVLNLQTQIGALQSEVVRLDQSLQDREMSVKAVKGQGLARGGTGTPISPQPAGEGPVYRTPSGFELPATAIQRALKNAGYYQGAIDGKVGSETKQAVRSFQRDHGLASDGIVGRQTWARLKSFLETVS